MMAVASKQEVNRVLTDVPAEYAFRSVNGHVLHGLQGLADELSNMTEEDYAFHANPEKNDFSNWVRDIVKDEKLARDLRKASGRAEAAEQVKARLSALRRKLATP